MSNVILYPDKLSAKVCNKEISEDTPTKLYVEVIIALISLSPWIVGKKETHFTADAERAALYTGKTRQCQINGKTVYIKTGLSTKDKWKGIEKTCELEKLSFEMVLDNTQPVEKVTETIKKVVKPAENQDSVELSPEDVIDDYIELLQLHLDDTLYAKENCDFFGSIRLEDYFLNLPKSKQKVLINAREPQNHKEKYFKMDFSINGDIVYYNNISSIPLTELEKYAELGYANAMYYMSLWYGSGYIGVKKIREISKEDPHRFVPMKEVPCILKPDYSKKMKYLYGAYEKGHAMATYAYACERMQFYRNNYSTGREDELIELFTQAKGKGIKDAEIMLRYFKQPKNTVVFNKFAMFGSYGFASNLEKIPDFDMFYKAEKNDLVHTTIIQHNGYLYYFKKDAKFAGDNNTRQSPYCICKKPLTGGPEIVVHRFLHKITNGHVISNIWNDNKDPALPDNIYDFGSEIYFGIYNDKIYINEQDDILCLDLDGRLVKRFNMPRNFKYRIVCPIGVDGGLLTFNPRLDEMYYYDFSDKSLQKIADLKYIIAITNKEVYYTKTTAQKAVFVYDVKTKTSSRINKVYSGLKKNTVVAIDAEHEIIYYAENTSGDICKSRILGINKYGEIVDIWQKPRFIDYKFTSTFQNTSTLTFNGKNHVVSLTDDFNYSNEICYSLKHCDLEQQKKITNMLKNTVVAFDRCGNAMCLYKAFDGDDQYNKMLRSFKYFTDDYLLVPYGNVVYSALSLYSTKPQGQRKDFYSPRM